MCMSLSVFIVATVAIFVVAMSVDLAESLCSLIIFYALLNAKLVDDHSTCVCVCVLT